MIHGLDDTAALDRALADEVAVIYKHSPRCGSSVTAAVEVGRFAERHPAVPVYQLDVVRDRLLARRIALRLAVAHASPQVIVLRRGRVVWTGSHGEVDAVTLETHLGAGSAA